MYKRKEFKNTMEDEFVFCKFNAEQLGEYGWALCRCSPSAEYGIRIKRREEDHFFSFECPRCGEKLGMVLSGTAVGCGSFNLV